MNEYVRNALLRQDGTIYRILSVKDDRLLVTDCLKKSMPKWMPAPGFASAPSVSEDELLSESGACYPPLDSLDAKGRKKAHERYTMIAPILAILDDDGLRNAAIKKIAEDHSISRKSLVSWLCSYLCFQDTAALAPKQRMADRELTGDQKNFRWALNRFYYTRHGNSLMDAFVMLLKERYCDEKGELLKEHPTINQFRYFYRTHKDIRKEYISRDGIKDYEMNHRPLLGDGVRQFAPNVGVGMVDATVCDIYLCSEAGEVIGRPVLVICADAWSGLCMGYSLLWEGGIYSVRELLLNIIADKKKWCQKFGISIKKSDWDCSSLPGKFVSDMGSEYASKTFEQVCDLGCTIENLPSFRPELKGSVEKLFGLIQDSFKPYLKGKGVIEPDFQKRGSHDYRKDACLTIDGFEKIVLECILYHNTKRVLSDFPYTEDMLDKKIPPHPSDIWNYGKSKAGADLIAVGREELIYTMLPRTQAVFSRHGLKANGLRYAADGYTEDYLSGGTVTAAYNPEDASAIYLIRDGYRKFDIIESRYDGMSFSEIEALRIRQKELIKASQEEALKARVEFAGQIEAAASQASYHKDVKIKSIRDTRKKEQSRCHRDLTKEAANA